MQDKGRPYTDKGKSLVCDLGMVKTSDENVTPETMSSGENDALELIKTNGVFATKHSDVYSFAMLIIEYSTEEPPLSRPYYGLREGQKEGVPAPTRRTCPGDNVRQL